MFFINLLFICFLIVCLLLLIRLFLHRTALIHVVRQWAEWLDDRVHLHQHIKVPEFNDSTHQENNLYRKVLLYVNSLPSLENSDYINLFSGKERNDIVLLPEDDQVISDSFLGARVSWIHKAGTISDSSKSFVLRIKKKDRRRILKPYLQHVHTVSDEIEEMRKELRIFNHSSRKWKSVPFDHPATFDTLVMDLELKNKIKNELEAFLKSKQYYQKLGRVWKRSYLLYGPSGTGKSSFIAAIANYLNYDVYNVNLSQVIDDGDLNALLIRASRKCLIVVEDLDRYESSITQSGLMNFMDGILNFEEERVMIFTTNTKDGIDQAILRPGRIDVHIYFPNCDFNSFKNLATNYLGVKEHKLFPQVEEIFMSGATMSPAEISELMLVNRNSPSRALKSVISALRNGSNNKVVVSRLSDSVASSPMAQVSVTGESAGAAWKEAVPVKELRKLYGLLKLKSCSNPGPLDHESRMIER